MAWRELEFCRLGGNPWCLACNGAFFRFFIFKTEKERGTRKARGFFINRIPGVRHSFDRSGLDFFRSPNWEITIRVFSKLFLWSQGLEPNPFWTRIFVSVFFIFSLSTWIGSREESKGRFKNWYLGLNPVLFGILVSSGLLIAVLFSADSQPFLYFVF